jgi:hypothetical protein
MIVERLKQEGLSDAYNEQAHGEAILLSVHTDSVEDRDRVIGILEDAGIYDFKQAEESVA